VSNDRIAQVYQNMNQGLRFNIIETPCLKQGLIGGH
jgi:hypothetical protein